MEVTPEEEEVAIDVIPLATKPVSIIDWKIHKEGKKSYYQIIKADGSLKIPVEDLDLVLYGDLKTMFEPHVEDNIWKNQSDYRGRIVRIKRLHDDLEVTAAKVCVTAAKLKLVLFSNLNEKYAK
ncbi:hypothetical protein Tco_1044649 [Tanacetum coccineum]|uniref:Uncharacterized protein n=1 Tax=Tanacetum coccineum TaxID=301880 RepID=A0ABQ5GRL2_9ASTR